jgi:solute carrier family 25 S-adenosylmethionine transporter 26
MNQVEKKEISWQNNIIIGGISRVCAITLFFPLDTIKTRIQNNNSNIFNPPYYYGYRIALLTQIPYGMIVFGTYENMKIILSKKYQNIPNIYIYTISAIISDMAGSLILTPGEVIKQNIQIGRYKNIFHAYKSIIKKNGINGLYQGYIGLIARDIPFRSIQLPLYENLKSYNSYNNIYITSLIGTLSGMIAGALTTPIDVIKTQLMCNNSNFSSIIQLYNKKGYYIFFSGLLQRIFFLGGSSSIFFIIYETLRNNIY